MNKYQDQVIQSASLQDAIQMLEEAVDYLKRLPVVPSTYQLINKIKNFIDNPNTNTAHRLSKEHSKEVELRKIVRTGCFETLLGATVIEVEVQGDSLKMSLPFHHTWRTAISQLKKGVVLELKTLKPTNISPQSCS